MHEVNERSPEETYTQRRFDEEKKKKDQKKRRETREWKVEREIEIE